MSKTIALIEDKHRQSDQNVIGCAAYGRSGQTQKNNRIGLKECAVMKACTDVSGSSGNNEKRACWLELR